MTHCFDIKKITAQKTYPIRAEILRKGTTLPVVFSGDDAPDTFHLGAFSKGILVGVATFVKVHCEGVTAKKQYQLRGMATLEKARGQGAGKALIVEAIRLLKEKRVRVLWCNARVIAVTFYKKHGFETLGDSFDVPQIGEHYKMICKI